MNANTLNLIPISELETEAMLKIATDCFLSGKILDKLISDNVLSADEIFNCIAKYFDNWYTDGKNLYWI